jgi:peptide/nickel transport system permease protein
LAALAAGRAVEGRLGEGAVILGLIVRRIVLAAVTLLIVSLIVFSMLEILPGDVASRVLGRDATPESLDLLRTRLGLDQPAHVRYLDWLGGLLTGDFGNSLVSNRAVSDIMGARIFNTILLSLYAFALYVPLTVIPAVIQAITRDQKTDHAFSIITLVLLSVPDFLLATILLLAFVIWIPVLPAISLVDQSSSAWEYFRAMTLPAFTLAIVMAVYAVRMLRDNLIEVLDSEYIRMAELKGASRRRVLLRHALPNALVPTLNVTALNLAYLVGGVVVVEKVFTYPGFGSLLVDSLQLRDLPVIEATVMIAALVYVSANLIADLAAILLNPRLRTS